MAYEDEVPATLDDINLAQLVKKYDGDATRAAEHAVVLLSKFLQAHLDIAPEKVGEKAREIQETDPTIIYRMDDKEVVKSFLIMAGAMFVGAGTGAVVGVTAAPHDSRTASLVGACGAVTGALAGGGPIVRTCIKTTRKVDEALDREDNETGAPILDELAELQPENTPNRGNRRAQKRFSKMSAAEQEKEVDAAHRDAKYADTVKDAKRKATEDKKAKTR